VNADNITADLNKDVPALRKEVAEKLSYAIET